MANQYKNKVIYNGTTLMDISDTTAVAADVASGKYFYTANGTKTAGTASGSGSLPTLITKTITTNGTYTALSDSADGYSSVTVNVPTSGGGSSSGTQHTILFEFEDETTATITAYYDSTFISNAITATVPTSYDSKTVTLAQLDGVTWYEVSGDIPLNTELVDYSAVRAGYVVGDSGAIEAGESWECVTDYIPIDPSMTFTFKMLDWYAFGLYDANKNVVQVYGSHDVADSTGNGTATGILNSSRIPSTAKYVVLVGNPYNLSSDTLSLIRTA